MCLSVTHCWARREAFGKITSDQWLGKAGRRISTGLPTKTVDNCVGHESVSRMWRGGLRLPRLPFSRRPRGNRVGSRSCIAHAQVIHKLANRNCGQARGEAGGEAAATFVSCAEKACRISSLCGLTSGNPQACQQKLWTTGRGRRGGKRAARRGGGPCARWRSGLAGSEADVPRTRANRRGSLDSKGFFRLVATGRAPSRGRPKSTRCEILQSDQGLDKKAGQISTSLPTHSVDKRGIEGAARRGVPICRVSGKRRLQSSDCERHAQVIHKLANIFCG